MNFKDYYNINETPIDTFKTLSKDKKGNVSDDPEKFAATNSSFKKNDDVTKRILTTPAAVHKIKNQFMKTEVNFDMYFYNGKEGIKNKEIGEVDADFVKNEFGLDIKPNPDNITIIYTSNTGDQKHMMTGWIIAHRFGHAARIKGNTARAWSELIEECVHAFNDIFSDCYQFEDARLNKFGLSAGNIGGSAENIIKAFYNEIGTFKSARDKKIGRIYEFYYELFAQFLITGKIHFNQLPKQFSYHYDKTKRWARVEYDEAVEIGNQYLNDLAEYNFPGRANNVLYAAQGKIFVM